MKNMIVILLALYSLISCNRDDNSSPNNADNSMYFPSNSSSEWATTSISTLGWNTNAINDLKNYCTCMVLVKVFAAGEGAFVVTLI